MQTSVSVGFPAQPTRTGPARDSVLVTLADRQYVTQARQLFASAYFNAGWRGDYLLLAHDIPEPELVWFEARGILVHRCPPLFEGRPGGMPPVLTSKFYLFTSPYKRWRTVIYCDADATIRASLDHLRRLEGFWSIHDVSRFLDVQIVRRQALPQRRVPAWRFKELVREVRARCDVYGPCFCAGFFVFDTGLIDQGIYDQLMQTMARYHPISAFGEQLTFNLVFNDSWQRLPPVYNIQVNGDRNQWGLAPSETDGIVIHYISPEKPWLTGNGYYPEWLENLRRSDGLDLSRIPAGRRWSQQQVAEYSAWLERRDRPASLWRSWIQRRMPQELRPAARPIVDWLRRLLFGPRLLVRLLRRRRLAVPRPALALSQPEAT